MSTANPPPPPGYNQAAGYNTVYPPPMGAQDSGAQPPQPGYPPQVQPPVSGYQTGYPAQPVGYPAQPSYPPSQPTYPQGGAYGGAPEAPPAATVGYAPAKETYTTVNAGTDDTARTHVWDDESGMGHSFSDKAIRRAFIRKVYLILTAQLLVTAAFISFFLFHEPTKYWVQTHTWFYWCSYVVFLVTYIALVCCPGVRRTWPVNFICLTVFTLAFSYMTATISSTYDTKVVLIAGGITAAVCLAITIFAMQTKIDFTLCTGAIFVLCMVVFFFGLSCMFVYIFWGPSYILQCVYGALAALLFSLFLAYDTQMLLGGRKFELSPEEYIFGSLQLYLDIVYLFLIILSFFGKS